MKLVEFGGFKVKKLNKFFSELPMNNKAIENSSKRVPFLINRYVIGTNGMRIYRSKYFEGVNI
ncbi:hypothetical protein J2S02_005149 [Metabacillus niabensis]|uniref:Uncharacterized protein n=1 Tax=Metabacillus niabensis TaxID=324854 RepID=A0ABT9Z8Z9_9BACI|nr:hypothetical protein [Metabacillus niabensis]